MVDNQVVGDCIYPDWEGGYHRARHVWDREGNCRVCGKTIRERYPFASAAHAYALRHDSPPKERVR